MHDPLDRDPALGRRLQALPEERAPYGFAELQRRARHPLQRRWALAGAGGPRLAAGLALTVVAGLSGLLLHAGGGAGPQSAQAPNQAATRQAATPDPDVIPAGQAAAMEGWLQSEPAEPAVVRAGARAAVVSLEDRIALLDDVISAERAARVPQARLAPIEQQRRQLLRSLVQVRYAEDLTSASP